MRKFNILPLAREFLHSLLCVMDMDDTCVEQQVSKRGFIVQELSYSVAFHQPSAD
jgi:hypothetical protein